MYIVATAPNWLSLFTIVCDWLKLVNFSLNYCSLSSWEGVTTLFYLVLFPDSVCQYLNRQINHRKCICSFCGLSTEIS